MSLMQQSRQAIKNLVFGDTLLPQEFTVGMVEPQAEIAVWLHGPDQPVDVTQRHSTACSDPFRVCIAFPDGQPARLGSFSRWSLKFCERNGRKRVLGEIGLSQIENISIEELKLGLFGARSAINYCLPQMRLYAHYLFHVYSQWNKANTSGMTMSFLDRRAAMVTFIRAHPVSLVSVVGGSGGNIFPMNIMGDLGNGYFAFALKDSRRAAHLVECAGQLALSSVPLSHASLAYQLAINHTKDSIAWEQLPFATVCSATFGIPVPAFAKRVRELKVETIHRIGSHTLFIARIIADDRLASGPELCVIHGFYQYWRLRGHSAELQAALAGDSVNKGLCHS
jgi:flavin reductase (DIM6/NTAB) family NADH-FMN oxidoreductase RutF